MGNTFEHALARSIAVLDEQRRILRAAGAPFAAELIDIALLELRRQHHAVSESELAELVVALEQHLKSSPADFAPADVPARDALKFGAETN